MNELDKRKTGLKIWEICDDKGIEVKDIVRIMSSVSKKTVYNWINGEKLPSIDNLYRLSVLLNVSMDELLVGVNDNAKAG
ncbi:MAG: helix-turn-helix transcriptional regulator [Lachnospiraceae bacterium]|nr:helix-turn-helix transcriptional regulator [Lachnospiraceae bacterium]